MPRADIRPSAFVTVLFGLSFSDSRFHDDTIVTARCANPVPKRARWCAARPTPPSQP